MSLISGLFRLAASPLNPLPRLVGADGRGSVGIVTIHGVHTPAMERVAEPPSSSIRVDLFERAVRDLIHKYTIISLEEAVAMLSRRVPWRHRCVVLTFDDSLQCTVEVAAPILSKLGVNATLFLTTAAIDEQKLYWWLRLDYALRKGEGREARISLGNRRDFHLTTACHRVNWPKLKSALRSTPSLARDCAVASIERQMGACLLDDPTRFPYALPMSWDGVRKLKGSGWVIGSHTVSHPNLALMTADEIRQEFAESRQRIELECAHPCQYVSYPYGGFTPQVGRIASEFYEAGTTNVSPGWNRVGGDLYALRRFAMPKAKDKLGYLLSGMPKVLDLLPGSNRTVRHGRGAAD